MRPDNPAGLGCPNIDVGTGLHEWRRRADGTGDCIHCGLQLNVEDLKDAMPDSMAFMNTVQKKAAGSTRRSHKKKRDAARAPT